jgi:hypothetical protein
MATKTLQRPASIRKAVTRLLSGQTLEAALALLDAGYEGHMARYEWRKDSLGRQVGHPVSTTRAPTHLRLWKVHTDTRSAGKAKNMRWSLAHSVGFQAGPRGWRITGHECQADNGGLNDEWSGVLVDLSTPTRWVVRLATDPGQRWRMVKLSVRRGTITHRDRNRLQMDLWIDSMLNRGSGQ